MSWRYWVYFFVLGAGVGASFVMAHKETQRTAMDELHAKAVDRVLDCSPIKSPSGERPAEVHMGRWTPRRVAIQVDGDVYVVVLEDRLFACTGFEWLHGPDVKCVGVPLKSLLEGR